MTKRFGAIAFASALVVAACGGGSGATSNAPASQPVSSPAVESEPAAESEPAGDLSGDIRIDGSSTVFPVTEAVAEEFQNANPGVRVTVAFSGTSGGFEKFCRGETDANDASRPIKEEEITACGDAGVTPVELPVAFDGLTVVVHPDNTFVECLTVAELNAIWGPDSTISNWSEVREGFPDQPLALYGAGPDSGTFDYFNEVINGESDATRSDYTPSEDDNALVQGVSGDVNALGYFGYAYYIENADVLKAVAIDDEEGDEGCVAPSEETINDQTYAPLSRPIYVYPSEEALARPEVAAFFQYYLDTVNSLLGTEEGQVGYIPLPDELLQEAHDNLAAALGE